MLFIQSRTGDAWPLVGRERQLKLIEGTYAAAGNGPGTGGVMLVGEPGVGKTRLAREALARMAGSRAGSGAPTYWVGATRSAATIPLGALGSLLLPPDRPNVLPDRAKVLPDRANVLPDRANVLPDRANGDRTAGQVGLGGLLARLATGSPARAVLAVDDAHLLDDASAAVLFQLAAERHAFVLATLTAGEPAPDPVTSLWTDEVATRVEVGPLAGAEIRALVDVALGGPMDAISSREIRRLAAGNPQLLRELLLAGQETGVLHRTGAGVAPEPPAAVKSSRDTAAGRAGPATRTGGWWRWEVCWPGGPGGIATTRLTDVITTRLGPLDPQLLALAELLAHAESLPLPMAARLAGDATVVAAERRGLVRVEMDGHRATLRLAHPLYAAVVRAGTPRSRDREIWRVLAAELQRTPLRRREDALLAAGWRDRAGLTSPVGLLLSAAEAAAGRLDLAEALRFAELAQAQAAGHGPTQAGAARRASMLRAELLILRGRYEEAGRALPEQPPDQAATARWRVIQDRIDYFGRGAAVANSTPDPWLQLASGRVAKAAESSSPAAVVAAGLLGTLTGAGELPPGQFRLAAGCVGLLAAGRLAEARTLADRCYDEAVRIAERRGGGAAPIVGAAAAVRGMVAKAQGRTGTALAGLTEAAVLLADWPPFQAQRLYLAELAAAYALRGELDAATACLEQADRFGDSPVRLLDAWVSRARAWVTAAAGDLTRAADEAFAAAGLARDTEQPTIQALALFDAARFGAAKRAHSHLTGLARRLRLPVFTALADAASALRSPAHGTTLDSAAQTLAEHGMLLHAAEAAYAAHARHTRAGKRQAANRSLVRATALAQECDGARTPLLAGGEPDPVLTSRERQVAALAAAGHSGPTIAAQLGLSVRTVNNYLGRTYYKLGINNRGQLADVLTTRVSVR